MSSPEDFNKRVIEEFRKNNGKVGGPFERFTLLLLHHKGAKSGEERVTPLVCKPRGNDFVIFASKAGADAHPAWFHNLVANPDAKIEVGAESLGVTARVAGPGEREEIWEPWKAEAPNFAEYEAKTKRTIPVVILERRG
ncbi:MAG: nitroreductase family deazaflavin-dependent oxidoreductase [Dehalococcoidia bacterium]